jgi:hypothetical protein
MRTIVLALFAVTVLSSCHFFGGERIRGNGNVVTQSRPVSNFKSIYASGAVNVYVTQDAAFSVKVQIDENLQEYIEVYEKNGVLHIHQADNTNLDVTGSMKIYVSAPMFEKLEASGASNITGEKKISSDSKIIVEASGASNISLDIKAPSTEVDVTGASTAILTGETKNLSIDGDGASHAKCFDLMAEAVDVEVSGASNADVFASVSLKADASGASDVKYKGAATHVGNASGAGSIKKVE